MCYTNIYTLLGGVTFLLMKLPVKKSTTFITLCASALAILAIVIGLSTSGAPSVQAQSTGGRLITVHDRGVDTAFITTKATLKEALDEQGITLDAKDAVEPAVDEKLVAPDYQVNIYRARPVTIVDGALRQKVVTPYQSAERIVKDAGIALYPEDETHVTRSADILADGAGLQLTIDRAVPLRVDLYGTITTIRTQAETIGAFLKEKGIELGEHGRVSVALDTPVATNMHVRIWREGKQTLTATEAVKFSVERIKDADRPVGYHAVQSKGRNGKRTVTYEITIKDGKEIARHEIASITITAPVKQVEIVGTKPLTLEYTGGGTKTEWLAASNIPEESWGYADYIVMRESTWNPNALNAASGACGLAQALPCDKVPGNPYNPIDSLNWMNGYVNGRYGGWANAYTVWKSQGWY